MLVTIFKSIKEVNTGFDLEIDKIFERIKNGNSQNLVEKIRKGESDLKQSLPSICFSGTFQRRRASAIKKHSGLICLDFDKAEDLQTLKDTINADPYTYASFVSPSGNGLKVLVKIPPSVEDHKLYFRGLQAYYNHENFDKATNDLARVCYESYDPDIFINKDSEVFTDKEEPDIEEITQASEVLRITSDYAIIERLEKWWERKFGFEKGNRNNNLIKLAYAFNDFGIKQLDAEQYFKRFEQSDLSWREISTTINSAYSKTENHGTKHFENVALKNKIKADVLKGKTNKDLKTKYPDVQKIELAIEEIKENLHEFWGINDKGKFFVVHSKFKEYLEYKNIYKYYTSKTSFLFIQTKENRVAILTPDQIKDIVLEELYERRNEIGDQPYQLMAGSPRYFKADYLNFLDSLDFEINRDTKTTCYLYYQNTALRITKDKIEPIAYIDLKGYVWEDQITNRPYAPSNGKEGQYRRFMWLISGQNDNRYNSFKAATGYLVHSYKNSGNNKAVILNDETISDNPNGRSGKGLFCKAISHLKRTVILNGKQFSFDKSFVYQRVNPDTQVLVFDDVKKNFDFERLFSLITEGIDIEKKNKDEIYISVEDSPKVLITTNYTIKGSGASHSMRKYELELSNHFNDQHTPLDEFGNMLFSDWDDVEWSMFDNFMIRCTQFYLDKGLVEVSYKNLKVRKFIGETSQEFYEWSKELSLEDGQRYYNQNLVADFTGEFNDYKNHKWFTNRLFSSWIEKYCKYYDIETVKGRDSTGRYISVTKSNLPF